MATKPRSIARDYALYLIIRLFVCLAQALPIRAAFALADLVAAGGYWIDRRHTRVATENLRHAFPEKSPAAIQRLAYDCYRHFCSIVVEIVLLPRKLRASNWRRFAGASIENLGPAVRPLLSNRPTLIVTGHFGNWEMAGYAYGVLGFRTFAIARVLDNPYLEDFLKRFRQATGQTMIAKKDDFDRLQSALANGGKVATLADQDAGPRGVFVDFFGRPASTHKAVALMALEFNAQLVVVGVPRTATEPVSDGRWRPAYRLVCEDVIDPHDYANRPDAVNAITTRYTAALERLIRRHPEQYFWLHRRWKSQPMARKVSKAA